MAEDTTGTTASDGQSADTGPASQATGAAPDATAAGQPDGSTAGASQSTTADGGSTGEDSFFDPKDIQDKPELVAAYKQMQRAFTKKMQGIKDRAGKADAYDAFNRDPIGNMQAMAQRLGYTLTRAEAAQQLQQQQTPAGPWEPKSWDEVLVRAKDLAKQEVLRELSPVFGEVQNIKRASIEKQLNDIDPTWHEFEDSMKDNLRQHPTLAKDPAMLYRLSVPPEVLESRAVQAALKKMDQKARSAKMAGASTTTKQGPASMPDRPVTFAEAVEIAKARLAEDGQRP